MRWCLPPSANCCTNFCDADVSVAKLVIGSAYLVESVLSGTVPVLALLICDVWLAVYCGFAVSGGGGGDDGTLFGEPVDSCGGGELAISLFTYVSPLLRLYLAKTRPSSLLLCVTFSYSK